jgi:hypothetical protein
MVMMSLDDVAASDAQRHDTWIEVGRRGRTVHVLHVSVAEGREYGSNVAIGSLLTDIKYNGFYRHSDDSENQCAFFVATTIGR